MTYLTKPCYSKDGNDWIEYSILESNNEIILRTTRLQGINIVLQLENPMTGLRNNVFVYHLVSRDLMPYPDLLKFCRKVIGYDPLIETTKIGYYVWLRDKSEVKLIAEELAKN